MTRTPTTAWEHLSMFAIVALVLFLFAAFGLDHLGMVALGWLGLAFLALHLAWPLTPWRRAA